MDQKIVEAMNLLVRTDFHGIPKEVLSRFSQKLEMALKKEETIYANPQKTHTCLLCAKEVVGAHLREGEARNAQNCIVGGGNSVLNGIGFATGGNWGSRVLNSANHVFYFAICDVCFLKRRHKMLVRYHTEDPDVLINGADYCQGWIESTVKNDKELLALLGDGLEIPPRLKELSKEEQEALSKIFYDGEERYNKEFEAEEMCWVHGHDESEEYCHKCAVEKAEELNQEEREEESDLDEERYFADGGWGSESDSIPYCHGCDKKLYASLTDYGCRDEVEHFSMYGFDPKSNDDCFCMAQVILSKGWGDFAKFQDADDEFYYRKLHRLGFRILEQIKEKEKK